ncbi:hypothetical protein Caci_2826 [Catenulispora acidiphila DSM 44928]|uniref:Uncharacterized protein n=1 Tax=Catenulispora acidiphila (strain DSM 44928 / JCM 14897 / NBRC 102108 / NRRL B-24433 / ID139908) TaxID=479433 RepID=C7Q160_CATAD|nr:hypothetical protein [Catenulispora acidiphila]ACU71735.1 hypothetical protein Caci_2826 [Catenulispora acidiphila DSM 44928]
MTEVQVPDVPEQDATATLTQAAEQVAGSADAVMQQLKALRTELHDATVKANEDIDAAKAKAAADVAAERRDRRYANAKFGIVVLLDIVLSLVSLGLWYSQDQTNQRLQTSLRQSYVTAQQQQETRIKVLCPLYQVLLTATTHPTSSTPGTPGQLEQFEKAVATIRAGYTTLGCTPALPKLSAPSG